MKLGDSATSPIEYLLCERTAKYVLFLVDHLSSDRRQAPLEEAEEVLRAFVGSQPFRDLCQRPDVTVNELDEAVKVALRSFCAATMFSRPGASWTDDDWGWVLEKWIWGHQKDLRIWIASRAMKILPRARSADSVDDIFQGFFASSDLRSVRKNYRPDKAGKPGEEPEGKFRAYLSVAVSNYAAKDLRRIARTPLIQFSEGEPCGGMSAIENVSEPTGCKSILDNFVEEEKRAMVLDCLRRIDEKHRNVIERHYLQEMSCAEMAKELGITENNVRVRLHRARQMLADCIAEKLGKPRPLEGGR